MMLSGICYCMRMCVGTPVVCICTDAPILSTFDVFNTSDCSADVGILSGDTCEVSCVEDEGTAATATFTCGADGQWTGHTYHTHYLPTRMERQLLYETSCLCKWNSKLTLNMHLSCSFFCLG